jgi:hypothetical protein
MVYFPVDQVTGMLAGPETEFDVRTAGDPAMTMRAMRRVMHDVRRADRGALAVVISGGDRTLAAALPSAADHHLLLLALLLAAVGTYSTLAY